MSTLTTEKFEKIVSRMCAGFPLDKVDWNKRVAPHLRELQSLIQDVRRETIESVLPNKDEKILACDNYSKDLDESIHFDDGFTECLSLLKHNLKSKWGVEAKYV